MSLPIRSWYAIRSPWWWSPAWFKKKIKPAFIGRMVGWHEVISLDSKRSCMYLFWSIFRVLAKRSQIIFHLMIVVTSSRSFILNSFISWSFNHSNALTFFTSRMRLFMYTLTIMSSSFLWIIKMYASTLVGIKAILWKNLMSVLFQSLSAYFNLYRLFSIL